MDYKKLVIQEYRRAVAESQTATPELKAALKTNDRVPAFIDRMSQELARAEHKLLIKRGKLPKLETLAWAVRSMTEAFLSYIEANVRDRRMSDAEAALRARKAQETLEPEKILAEMGVVTDDPGKETEEAQA